MHSYQCLFCFVLFCNVCLLSDYLTEDKKDAALVLARELITHQDCGSHEIPDILNMCSVVLFACGDEKGARLAINKAKTLKEGFGEDTSSLDETLKQFDRDEENAAETKQ
jgi:hypothetical protein